MAPHSHPCLWGKCLGVLFVAAVYQFLAKARSGRTQTTYTHASPRSVPAAAPWRIPAPRPPASDPPLPGRKDSHAAASIVCIPRCHHVSSRCLRASSRVTQNSGPFSLTQCSLVGWSLRNATRRGAGMGRNQLAQRSRDGDFSRITWVSTSRFPSLRGRCILLST